MKVSGFNSILEQFSKQSRQEQRVLERWLDKASNSPGVQAVASSQAAASASSFTFNTQDLSSAAETVQVTEGESPASIDDLADCIIEVSMKVRVLVWRL